MEREGAGDSLSEASEHASTNNVNYGVSDHMANTFPTAAPYGAASMGAPQVSSWDTGNGCAQAQPPTQSCGGTFGPTGHSPLPSTLHSTPPWQSYVPYAGPFPSSFGQQSATGAYNPAAPGNTFGSMANVPQSSGYTTRGRSHFHSQQAYTPPSDHSDSARRLFSEMPARQNGFMADMGL